jgi:hypothetical protein
MADDAHGHAPVHMPSPTPWPMVMGLAITCMPGGFALGPRLGGTGSALHWVPLLSLFGLVLFWVALYMMVRQDIDEAGQGGH